MAHIGEALTITVIGMGVVFLALITLMYMVKILNWAAATPPAAGVAAPDGEKEAGEETALLLAAAAGHFLESETEALFSVPVKRSRASAWAGRARIGAARPRRNR
jgi:Na+-transporting methylmalonyl-CoA/oxaloacetate decarboxylase gamma subunit